MVLAETVSTRRGFVPRKISDIEIGPHLVLTRALEVFSLGSDKPTLSGSGLCPENSRSPREAGPRYGKSLPWPTGLALAGSAGDNPSRFSWCDHSAGASRKLAVLMPRGRRPSIAALTRSGAMNAIEIVMLT